MPPPKPSRPFGDRFGKYWNPSQPSYLKNDDEDSDGSDMSIWASENEGPLKKPVFKNGADEVEWERKQRNREYRVAARREKRNRKADEKKQRKLNATILRRMTKNPEKYNKNVDRNRLREVEMERRRIYSEAVKQAERLAAIHDPTGKMFNVGPVVVQEDGKVVSVEFLERKAQAQAERAAKLEAEAATKVSEETAISKTIEAKLVVNGVNPERMDQIQLPREAPTKHISKNQQKKLAIFEDRLPPSKPVIPDGIELPEGEENWLELWNLSNGELERRVIREKKRKAAERKALREKQKEGKVERRAARDERRKVYREKKLEWKAIKEEEKIQKKKLLRVEQEEAKKIALEVNIAERVRAMKVCAELGFTLHNVEGVDQIKPKALGMKGQEVDFGVLEVGDRPSELKIKDPKLASQIKEKPNKGNRVDLGKAPDESKTTLVASGSHEIPTGGLDSDFVSFDIGGENFEGQEFQGLNYNHKLRRKLHRAIEAAQIKKELLVRQKAKEYCEANEIEVPAELAVEYTPIKLTGRRTLEDGSLETEKQERVRKRLELAEYNKAAKVLRAQAKAEAIEAGLRVFAELTGKKAAQDGSSPALLKGGSPMNGVEVLDEDETLAARPSSKKRRRDDDSDVRTEKKSKKLKKSANSGDDAVADQSSPEKMAKKTTRTSKAVSEKTTHDKSAEKSKKRESNDHGDAREDQEAEKERKRLKKYKKAQEAEEALATPEIKDKTIETHNKKSNKSKLSSKKDKKEKASKMEAEEANGADQWNPGALNGDSARKDKFLRLLGAGKTNGTVTAENPFRKEKARKSFVNITVVENELERQFEAGVRMKHDGQGKRRGLGA